MATNIELEKQIIALKAEVATIKASSAEAVKAELADLKSTLATFFNNRFFEQPDARLAWDRLTTPPVSAKETAVIHKAPVEPTPEKRWHDTIQSALTRIEGQNQ